MSAAVCVLGMGTAVPENRLSAEAFAELAIRLSANSPKEEGLVRAVARRSGVAERGIVLPRGESGAAPFYPPLASPGTAERMGAYEELAPALAAAAARAALANSGIDAGAITHLVTASCTGFSAPGVDLYLVGALGLSADVARVHVGFMGCHGAVNACRMARALASENTDARVLVVAVELCTIHFQYGLGRDELLPNALFADGAAAMVIGAGEAPLRLLGTASRVIPNSAHAMTWRIADTGFRMTLDSSVPDLIAAHVRVFVESALARHGLSVDDVAGWAIHPGGPRVIDSALAGLGLPSAAGDASRDVLRHHGNMSSATVLFVLEELLRRGTDGPIAALAFGPGLTAELALFAATAPSSA